jgi:hypothetical protein
MTVVTVTSGDVIDLCAMTEGANPVMAASDTGLELCERMYARVHGWVILAYRVDIVERFGLALSIAEAETVAEEINAAQASRLAVKAAESVLESVPAGGVGEGTPDPVQARSVDESGPEHGQQ